MGVIAQRLCWFAATRIVDGKDDWFEAVNEVILLRNTKFTIGWKKWKMLKSQGLAEVHPWLFWIEKN